MPVIVNVAGESVDDYVAVVRKLDGLPGVAGIELNISCPNVGKGGLQFALDADAAGEVTAAVRQATDLPLMVKLSPGARRTCGPSRGPSRTPAPTRSAPSTRCRAWPWTGHRRRPLLGNTYGGLSGPALKPVALRVVYEVAQVVQHPDRGHRRRRLARRRARLPDGRRVRGPGGHGRVRRSGAAVRLIDELAEWCAARGLGSHRELVGAALPAGKGGVGHGKDRPSVKGVEYRP